MSVTMSIVSGMFESYAYVTSTDNAAEQATLAFMCDTSSPQSHAIPMLKTYDIGDLLFGTFRMIFSFFDDISKRERHLEIEREREREREGGRKGERERARERAR